MLILDTDVLTIVQRANSTEYDRLVDRLDESGADQVCVAIISFEEQMRGWLGFIAKAKSLEGQSVAYGKLQALLEDFQTRPVLDFDAPVITVYRRLLSLHLRLGTMDLKIAATALAHGAVLISRNLADFRKVPGLQVEDWTKP